MNFFLGGGGITGITLDPHTHTFIAGATKNAFRAVPPPYPTQKSATFRSSSTRCTHQHSSSSYCPSLPPPPLPCPPSMTPWPVLGPWSPRPPSSKLPSHLQPFNPVTHQHTYCTSTMQPGLFCSLVRHSPKNIKRLMPFGNSAGGTQFK